MNITKSDKCGLEYEIEKCHFKRVGFVVFSLLLSPFIFLPQARFKHRGTASIPLSLSLSSL